MTRPADDGLRAGREQSVRANPARHWDYAVLLGEDRLIHSGFDRMAGPTVRRGRQIHGGRPDYELEPVTGGEVRRSLQRQVDVHR